jgi:methylated-DNA-protein-cysteine methyltransferase related protein
MTVERGSVFTRKVRDAVRAVPRGRVATYGQIAALAGRYGAARGVAWVLHSSAEAERLPWHRVINAKGGISLKPGKGFEIQRRKLEAEGVSVDRRGLVDLKRFQWEPSGHAAGRSRAAREFLRKLTGGR